MGTGSPPIKFISIVDHDPMLKIMPNSAAAVTQPITKIFNPVQNSLINPFMYDEYYSIQNPYGYHNTHHTNLNQN